MLIEQEIRKKEEELKRFKPIFYGFTGGIRKDESMEDFVKRVNDEGGKNGKK